METIMENSNLRTAIAKKLIYLIGGFAGLLLICSLCACGGKNTKNTGQAQALTPNQDDRTHASFPQDISDADSSLRFLCDPKLDSACSTAEGYYYLTEETVELKDGNYGSHLMYMDYATRQEIYLCSTAGCSHDSPDCPAVFLYDDFPTMSTRLFVYRDSLYILSRKYDSDGSMGTYFTFGDDSPLLPEDKPAVLYQAGLDGTNRRKVYTFDSALTLEDTVLGDADGIYVIAKKLSMDNVDQVTYVTSSERKLLFLEPDSGDMQELCSLNFADDITRQIAGCTGDALILSRTDFGRTLSREEYWDDKLYKEMYETSSTVYEKLNSKTGMLREFCRVPNTKEHSCKFIGEHMYLSFSDSGDIQDIDIRTGSQEILCSLPQSLIMDAIGDTLCCRTWNLSEDFTWYFVDTATGTVSHSTLVNQCNGWDLDFRAVSLPDVLTVYDYDATAHNDGSYEIHQYRYALISMADLLAGNENYRPITMIGKGL